MLILYVHKYVSSNLRQQTNMEVHQQFLNLNLNLRLYSSPLSEQLSFDSGLGGQIAPL